MCGMCDITRYEGDQWWRQSDDMIVEYLWNVYNVKISDMLRHTRRHRSIKWVKYRKLHFSYPNVVHWTHLLRQPVITPKWWNHGRISLEYFECQKISDMVSDIDLLLTNKAKCFQNMIGVSTGLSDFQKWLLHLLKWVFQRISLLGEHIGKWNILIERNSVLSLY